MSTIPVTLVLLLLSIVIFQLFFLSVGLVISLLVKRVRSVTPYAPRAGLRRVRAELPSAACLERSNWNCITPFKHLDPAYIVKNGAYDTPLVLLNVAVILVSLAVSYLAVHAPRHSGGVVRRCMMNIFLRELKANLKSLVIWSVIIAC